MRFLVFGSRSMEGQDAFVAQKLEHLFQNLKHVSLVVSSRWIRYEDKGSWVAHDFKYGTTGSAVRWAIDTMWCDLERHMEEGRPAFIKHKDRWYNVPNLPLEVYESLDGIILFHAKGSMYDPEKKLQATLPKHIKIKLVELK